MIFSLFSDPKKKAKISLINLQIPKNLLNAAITIEIGLRDFPILLEATAKSEDNAENNVLRKADTFGGGTDYQIRWGDGNRSQSE